MNRRGLSLVYVLLMLVLIQGALLWMSQAAGNVAWESNRLEAEAWAENLAASGSAWLEVDRVRQSGAGEVPVENALTRPLAGADAPSEAQPRTLDLSELDAPRATLTVERADDLWIVRSRCRAGSYQARRDVRVP